MNSHKAHRSSVNQTPKSNIVHTNSFLLAINGALYEDGLSYKIIINILYYI